MGLTDFLRYNKDVKEKFSHEFKKPKFNVQKELLVPPLTDNYRLVGSRFHYKMSEYINKLNSNATGFEKLPEEDISKEDKEDIQSLLSIIPSEVFKSNERCIINPTFALIEQDSTLIHDLFGTVGSFGDLILDDMLIEVKVTKEFKLERKYLDQLLGYYALYRIYNFDEIPVSEEIKKLGIYFARHGYLHVIDVKEVVNEDTFPDFMAWFVGRIEEETEDPFMSDLLSGEFEDPNYGNCPKCGLKLEKAEERGYMTEGQRISYEAGECGTIYCPGCDWSRYFEI
jgi:hypothetical protein